MVGDINHIVVIESLKNERETGKELYNDTIRRHIGFRKSSINHRFHEVHTKEGFVDVLNFYRENSPYMGGGILIHLEMHGDADLNGLVLSNGTLLTWAELVSLFRPINVISRNNLYISMATCNGRYLYKGVDANEKSPYSCFISASQTVYSSEIIEQFSVLFEKLISDGNLVNAYLEMEKQGTLFYYKDSNTTFEDAFKVATEKFLTDPSIRESIMGELAQKLKEEGLPIQPDYPFDFILSMVMRDMYIKYKATFDFSD